MSGWPKVYTPREGQQTFWHSAKIGNSINDKAFKAGFIPTLSLYTKEHNLDTDIYKLFDDQTGRFKDKNSYAVIKKLKEIRAAERSETDPKEDIDYAIMALAKFWSMQFIDNLKTISEEEAERDTKWKAERDAKNDAKAAEKSEQYNELLTMVDEFKAKIEPAIAEIIDTEIIPDLTKKSKEFHDLSVEIHNTDYDLKYAPSIAGNSNPDNFPIIDKLDWQIVVSAYGEPAKYDFGAWTDKTLTELPGIAAKVTVKDHGYYIASADYDMIKNRGIDDSAQLIVSRLEKDLKEGLEKPYVKVGDKSYTPDHYLVWQKIEIDEYTEKADLSKKAAADANAGRSTADFEKLILDLIKKGIDKAESERKSWSGYAYDDGDSGAAYYGELANYAPKLYPYLGYCNWTASDNDGYSITYKTNSDLKTLQNTVSHIIGGIDNFKVLADDEVDEPKKTFADSADYSDELIKDYDTEA